MKNLSTLHATEYAWIGDAVITQHVRAYLLKNTDYKVNSLQRESKKYVAATAQAKMLQDIFPALTEAEQTICKRGRNAHTGHAAKNAAIEDYKAATALEALVGWLYLTENTERLDWVLCQIIAIGEGTGVK